MTVTRFTNLTISITIDGIHYEIHSTTPDDAEWYTDVYNDLKEYYKDRIELRYKQLQKLISKIIE
jgi:hypothetical protein